MAIPGAEARPPPSPRRERATRARREPARRPAAALVRPDVRESQPPVVEQRRRVMPDAVYRVTEVIGVSGESWEAAARNAVETAGKTVRDLRIAEATRFDVTIQDGKVASFRVRLDISFKYDAGD